jgi:transposase
VDEKTAIRAVDRVDPLLPISPGRAARQTSQEFAEFLTKVVERAPAREVHIILDNLSAHKSQVVRDFLATHPSVRFHSTLTYSSWLNQVEIWFSKVKRDMIARGVFSSVKDLARELRRYINAYSANAEPTRWKYSDPTRRIRADVVSAILGAELCGEIEEVLGEKIELVGAGHVRFVARAEFEWTMNECRAQSCGATAVEIRDVSANQQDFAGLEIEKLRSH